MTNATTNTTNRQPDRGALVYRYHERLYRLALLIAGDANAAARLVEQAYRTLPADDATPETTLVRALLAGRPALRRRWSPAEANIDRATLDRDHAGALLALLARLTPIARLTIGLYYLAGSSPDEIAAQLGPSVGDQPVVELLSRFRADAARAAGPAPAGADADALLRIDRFMSGLLSEEESLALRRDLLEQPELRELREAVSATRDLLPRAIPALFAVTPPVNLADRLLQIVAGPQKRSAPTLSTRRAQGLLALGVLTLAAAIVLIPSLLASRATSGRDTVTAIRAQPNAPELLDAAIHRFERAPVQTGVLHEQYRIEQDGRSAYIVDRLYDYAAPHRLAISASEEGANGPPVLQISSDGRSLVQFRGRGSAGPRRLSFDASVSADEAQAVLPLLRGQPQPSAFTNAPGVVDPGPLYLAQARAAGATLLGQATTLGRSAILLTYRTKQLPGQSPAEQTTRVVLTLDAETYALLDVALLTEGAAEATARHPVQAQQFELLASVPDDRFRLRSSPRVTQRDGITSVRFPFLDDGQFLSLDDAARQATQPILAPRDLPDEQMRGLAIAVGNGATPAERTSSVALLYEGEFQDVIVMPNNVSGPAGSATGEERSAGDYRYRLVGVPDFSGGVSALVYRPNAPEQPMTVMLNAEFATAEERETMLAAVIASLTPVDAQSLPTLRRNFHLPSAPAGKS
jgi:hypothetical protein